MKRKLLLAMLFVASAIGFNANAQETPVNDGVYYIYNQSGLFLSRGSGWGTRGVAKPVGLPWKVSVADGKYTLRMYDITIAGSTKEGFGSNAYTDNGSPLAFTPSGDAANGFTLQNGSNFINCPAKAGDVNLNTTASKWQFLTQAQYNAVLAEKVVAQEAAIASQKGITIPAGKTLNDVVTDVDNWAASAIVNDGVPTSAKWTATKHDKRGGNNNWGDYGSEMYQCGNAHYTRTITGLKQGIYKISVRGMKRMAYNDKCVTMGAAGYPISDSYLSANGNIIRIKSWYEDKASDTNPNSTSDFVQIVNNKGYTTEGFAYVGADGKLELDVSSEAFWDGSWFLFNGISYVFYDNSVSDSDAEAILEQATNLESVPMLGATKSALTDAKTTFSGSKTIANYNTLSTAISNATASKDAYANAKTYFDEAETILAGTNVYTASAYAEYFTTPKAAYDARTLENAEAAALKPTSTGWHSDNTIDDILLSAWKIGGEQCKNYDKSLYINTWSVEGNNDGSDFLTPFFEYWTNDDKSLDKKTITATVDGLKPNKEYSVAIRSRVRQANGKAKIAEGVTMKVGSGETVDISAGALFNAGSFYIGNFSAIGSTDAEGKLTVTIEVAENSNISWLSFYNVKYTDESALAAQFNDLKDEATEVLADATYKPIIGSERTDVETAKGATPSTFSEYVAANTALRNAIDDFKGVLPRYKALDNAKAVEYPKLPYASETKYAAIATAQSAVATSASDADAKVEAILTANRIYVESNALAEGVGGIDKTSLITDANITTYDGENKKFGAWEVFGQTNGTIQVLSGESFTDGNGKNDYKYADIYKNDNNAGIQQTVSLTPGKYMLTVTARGKVIDGASFKLFAGTDNVDIPRVGNTGGTFNRGWNDVSLVFTVTETANVNIGVQSGNGKDLWWSATRFRLVQLAEVTSVKAAGYASFSSEYALDLDNIEGGKAYIVKADAVSGDNIIITPQAGKVAANTGLILKTDGGAAGTITIPVAASGATVSENKLVAVTEDATAVAADNYVLGAKSDNSNVGLYKLASATNLNKGQAYLPGGFSSVKVLNFIIEGETPTGVEAPAVAEAEEDGVIYNVNGQVVDKNYKGIVIKNGKKYINK